MGHSCSSLVKWKWAGQGTGYKVLMDAVWPRGSPRRRVLGIMSVQWASAKAERDGGVRPLAHSETTSLSSGVRSVQHPTALCYCNSRCFLGNTESKELGDGVGLSLIPEPGLSPLCFTGLRGPDFLARLDHIVLGGREHLSVFRAAWGVLGGIATLAPNISSTPEEEVMK